MKRLSVIGFCLLATLSSFAYYGSYSSYSHSSSSSAWDIIVAIIVFVGGVLEIILFFKLWKMTNNIKALTKDHFNETVFETKAEMARYLRKNLVLGNMENVKKTLLKNFIENIEHDYWNLRSSGYVKDENGNEKWVSFEETNLDKSITPYVEKLSFQYDKIGEELPVYISRMKTFRDYFKIFVKEDLIMEIKKEEE